jgi:hypothetical protein
MYNFQRPSVCHVTIINNNVHKLEICYERSYVLENTSFSYDTHTKGNYEVSI